MAALAIKDQAERSVEVNREKLIKKLIANRKKHLEEYQEAVAGYKEEAIRKLNNGYEKAKQKLEDNLAVAKMKIEQFNENNPRASSDYLVLVEGQQVELKVPRNYSKEYDAAIDMAQWDERETLELTHAEFQCFVRDEWAWTNEFTSISAIYNKKFL